MQNSEELMLAYKLEHNLEWENNALLLMINDDDGKYYYFGRKKQIRIILI